MEAPALETTLRWIVAAPLIGAALNGLLNRRLPRPVVGALACGSVGLSFALALAACLRLAGLPSAQRLLVDPVATWIAAGALKVEIGFVLDPLSAVMVLIVTGVSFLIHVYSLGYMAHDPGFQRYFAYLNLFVFAMLTLVLADNLLLLFVGWEGVGLCSYLLISFWFADEEKASAGKKAFIVNRVGDFGFLLGMLVIGAALLPALRPGETLFGFATLAAHTDLLAPVATAACLLLFLGATGKSAQIPLYVWLPDAMAGPTPVSALIHAATMVTAGVYLIARLNFLFVLSPTALAVVAVVGAATALVAATIALAQTDIKKVLAYSTVSQLGYMTLACGVGAFGAGIFHLMTHAFFKALLFLGSGSVIHAMSGEQDMRRMGGLARRLPVTFWTFLAGTLAIAGVFPLAGFFSKDEILWRAFSGPGGSPALWAVGFAVAGLTAFYMMRLVALTFGGQNRAAAEVRHHIHESPPTMTAPLVALALLSVAGGWIGWPHFLGGSNRFEAWLEPVFHAAAAPAAGGHHGAVLAAAEEPFVLPAEPGPGEAAALAAGHVVPAGGAAAHLAAAPEHAAAAAPGHAAHAAAAPPAAAQVEVAHAGAAHAGAAHDTRLEWLLMLLSVALALGGLLLSWWVYTRRPSLAVRAAGIAGGLPHRVLAGKYYLDELYDRALLRPTHALAERVLWRRIDAGLIDGLLVNGTALSVAIAGGLLRLLQTGLLRSYAYAFAVGVTVFVLYLTLSS